MKHLTSTIISIFVLIIPLGCNKSKNAQTVEGDYPIIYAGDIKPDNNSLLHLSEFVERIDIIPLEFDDSCILGEIRKIVIHDDNIFIIERRRPTTATVYRFDMQGNFINTIGKYGQGPSDILELHDFSINEEENKIYLLDSGKKAILCYSFDGKFIEKININQNSQKFEYFNNHFFVYIDNTFQDRPFCFTVLDTKGELENSYFPSRFYPITISRNSFVKTKDSLFFYKPMNDTIYAIHGTELKYAFYFDFGKMRFTPEEVEDIYNEKVHTMDVMRDKERFSDADNIRYVDKWLYFNKVYKFLSFCFLYNTETEKLRVTSFMSDDIEYMFNNNQFYGQTEDAFIGLYNAENINQSIENFIATEKNGYISKTKMESQMQKMKNLKRGDNPEEMNPWVLIYHLK
jgi:hypothetical protein